LETLKPFVTRTRIEGLVILFVALAYLWEAHNVPEFYQIPGVPGPTTFPYLLGVIFAACGVWLLISPKDLVEHIKARQQAPADGTVPSEPQPGLFSRITAQWHLITMWAVIIAYLWFMPDLGFPLATFALLVTFFYLLGETRWLVNLGLALASTAVIYLIFKVGLNVRLPLGALDFLSSK
jgi:hypothetical protein